MLAVVLEGGLVQAVITDDPKCPINEVTVIDYDTDDLTAAEARAEASMISQSPVGGNSAADAMALVRTESVVMANGVAATIRPVEDADLADHGYDVADPMAEDGA